MIVEREYQPRTNLWAEKLIILVELIPLCISIKQYLFIYAV